MEKNTLKNNQKIIQQKYHGVCRDSLFRIMLFNKTTTICYTNMLTINIVGFNLKLHCVEFFLFSFIKFENSLILSR